MPILLRFEPKKTNLHASEELEEALDSIISQIFVHAGFSVNISLMSLGIISSIDYKIKGLCLNDKKSANMLHSLVTDAIGELQVYLTSIKLLRHEQGEALFSCERYKPKGSINSERISHIPDLVIPHEYCGVLIKEIMDEPVYDIRSPGVVYEKKQLLYWLNQSNPKLMPDTRLPFNKCYLKTHYDLKEKINRFVKESVEAFEQTELQGVAAIYGVNYTGNKEELNQALRRAAAVLRKNTKSNIEVLLRGGARIDGQDNNPKKLNTALHWALIRENVPTVFHLLRCGASVEIKNAAGKTALDLMRSFSDTGIGRDMVSLCIKLNSRLAWQGVSTPSSALFSASREPEEKSERPMGKQL